MPQRERSAPGTRAPARGRALPLARLGTNATAGMPVHRWFSTIAGFAPEFVSLCCRPSDRRLLDPFAGCGTALVEARALGMDAVGYEPHAFFARIARAKASYRAQPQTVAAIRAALQRGLEAPVDPEQLGAAPRAFLSKLFERAALAQLLGARRALEAEGWARDDLAFLMLSRVLDHSSCAQTDGIYKAPTSRKRAEPPGRALERVAVRVSEDLEPLSAAPRAALFDASSESMAELGAGSIDVIVTSPPYLNNFDFAEMARMYLYFWGICDSWRSITDAVRSRLIVNTTTALRGHREQQSRYRDELPHALREPLDALVAALHARRRERAGRKEYDRLVYPYFAQMQRVLAECLRVLAPGGSLNLAIADAAFYGVHVSTPQWLAELLAGLGFADVHCERLRVRGERWRLAKRAGSPLGLGEYRIRARREG